MGSVSSSVVDFFTGAMFWLGAGSLVVGTVCLPLAVERAAVQHRHRLLWISCALYAVGTICAIALYFIISANFDPTF